jgi:hypothetical protein
MEKSKQVKEQMQQLVNHLIEVGRYQLGKTTSPPSIQAVEGTEQFLGLCRAMGE